MIKSRRDIGDIEPEPIPAKKNRREEFGKDLFAVGCNREISFEGFKAQFATLQIETIHDTRIRAGSRKILKRFQSWRKFFAGHENKPFHVVLRRRDRTPSRGNALRSWSSVFAEPDAGAFRRRASQKGPTAESCVWLYPLLDDAYGPDVDASRRWAGVGLPPRID